MIHIELSPSTFIGIGITLIGIFLYLLRTKNPIASRGAT